jgi:hypothetical protein
MLCGDPQLYYLLNYYDPEFSTLFKVAADFDDAIARGADKESLFARQLATMIRREKLRPLRPRRRRAGHRAQRPSGRRRGKALHRSPHHLRPSARGRLLHRRGRRQGDRCGRRCSRRSTPRSGARTACASAATRPSSVDFYWSIPKAAPSARSTACPWCSSASWFRPPVADHRAGAHRPRQADRHRARGELGGKLHSKGVLILSAYHGRALRARPPAVAGMPAWSSSSPTAGSRATARPSPRSMRCSRPSSDVPLRQDIAVTGSVDQHGDVQAIGGVNEKVEGFFDVCRQRGADRYTRAC